MSCSSPFIVQESEKVVDSNSTVTCTGNYTLNSYSVKWGGGSWCIGCSVTDCCWKGWQNTDLKCDTKWVDCCWGIDYPCWTIELWPTITFGASVDIPFTFGAEAGIQLTVDTPAEPYRAKIIELDSCNLTLTVDSTNITIQLIDTPIELESEDGKFSISVPLESWSSSSSDWGLNYTLCIDS